MASERQPSWELNEIRRAAAVEDLMDAAMRGAKIDWALVDAGQYEKAADKACGIEEGEA
jgi:hypothetical protein